MRCLKWLDENFERLILSALIVLIVVVLLVQIVLRYIFNQSLVWSEEFCRYCYIFFMFIGMSLATKKGSNYRVDAVVGLMPRKAQKVILFVVDLFVLAVLVYLLVGSIPMEQELYRAGSFSAGLKAPDWLIYMAAPIGICLTIFRYLQNMVRMLKRNEEGGEEKC